jgi:hypothetical protein
MEVNVNVPILQLKDALQNIPDPRSKQGVSHPFHGILALVILGLHFLCERKSRDYFGVDGTDLCGCELGQS